MALSRCLGSFPSVFGKKKNRFLDQKNIDPIFFAVIVVEIWGKLDKISCDFFKNEIRAYIPILF
jgi:hypothetical protein